MLSGLRSILTKNIRLALACTGAGAGVQGHLWAIPGISSVLVEASFPYAPEATDEYLGFTPRRYCSEETAILLAMESYYRAYRPGGSSAIGVGLTASVASNSAHRGEHRAHAAYFRDDRCEVYTIILDKGLGEQQRALDGNTCDHLASVVIQEATGESCDHPEFEPDFVQRFDKRDATKEAEYLFFATPYFSSSGARESRLPLDKYVTRGAVFPGAFNPPHQGHFGMARSYEQLVGGPVAFNIEARSPHKGDLSVSECLRRAKSLKGQNIIFTRGAPLYLDKATLFPGVRMVIGVDALSRTLDPKWGPDIPRLVEGFQDTEFYVFDRQVNGELITLNHLQVPVGLRCQRLTGRWDISSTQLREPSPQSTPQ